jgi:tetratricopeptide (TPR) repeat protein
MSDRKESRARPARTWRAVAALAAITATIVAAGCTHNPGTATANQAAARAKTTSTTAATGGLSKSDATTLVATLLQAGINQAEQKNWAAATTTFNDVLALSPRNVYALYNLGLVDQSTSNISGADSYYDQAIAVDANYTPALYNLAITLESSDPSKALSLYQKIVSINPQASTAYLRMAFVYARQGDLAQARAAQAKAIAIDPSLGKYQLPAAK